jgi:hypothetical protein
MTGCVERVQENKSGASSSYLRPRKDAPRLIYERACSLGFIYLEALKCLAGSDIREEASRIGMEMQEGPAFPIEHPTGLLLEGGEGGEGAQANEQRLEPVQILRPGVPHGFCPKTFMPASSAMASMAVSPLLSP